MHPFYVRASFVLNLGMTVENAQMPFVGSADVLDTRANIVMKDPGCVYGRKSLWIQLFVFDAGERAVRVLE
jgi:hypothetical protein